MALTTAGRRRTWQAALVVAVLVQLVVLYAPTAGGASGVPGLDKLVHLAVFAAVAVTGRGAGLPVLPLGAALLAHAVLSEVVQARLLADRSGDPLDAVADALGALLGLALAVRSGAGSSRRRAEVAAGSGRDRMRG